MFDWYQQLSTFDQLVGMLLVPGFCLVMFLCLLSFLRHPFGGWYRGFQSSPLFQLVMWLGAMPFILPLVYLYLRRRRMLRSAQYIGNLRSKKFHQPSCEYQRRIRSNFFRFPLASKEDARRRGFQACQWCSR